MKVVHFQVSTTIWSFLYVLTINFVGNLLFIPVKLFSFLFHVLVFTWTRYPYLIKDILFCNKLQFNRSKRKWKLPHCRCLCPTNSLSTDMNLLWGWRDDKFFAINNQPKKLIMIIPTPNLYFLQFLLTSLRNIVILAPHVNFLSKKIVHVVH